MSVPLRTTLAWQLTKLLEGPPVMQQPAETIRAASDRRRRLLRRPGMSLATGRPDKRVAIDDSAMTLDDGTDLALRVYRVRGGRANPPVVVNFHGGGWVSGDPRQSEWWCAGVAAGADVVVVSVDYRLAPEYPCPIPAEDCYAATVWLSEHAAELSVDASRLAVMGDSAGGNLAAVVSIMARDRGGPAIALQVLLYPSVDLGADYPSKDENANAPVLTKRDLDSTWKLYLSGEVTDPADPRGSPLFAEHHDLPPALIQTAQHDPLRDQGPAYAAALRTAAVPVRLTNYVDAVHGYISLPVTTVGARQALGEAVAEIRSALG